MSSDDYAEVAREYYNSAVHQIYRECWGGENHHLGIFDDVDDFYHAAKKANENLVGKLRIDPECRILDIGSGFCGLPRFIARNTPCRRITALNISDKENDFARRKNDEEGLGDMISVIEADYNDMPFADDEFDILVSQDSMLHSPDKKMLLRECARVLKKGGQFVFSDILEESTLSREEAERIYARVRVPHLSSFHYYRRELPKAGFNVDEVQDLGSENLAKSYQAVHDILSGKKDRLVKEVDVPLDVIENALAGLSYWVEKALERKIGWGLFAATHS
ncbi:MAG: methyltransferase domain-containing protein [Actinomycetota bacterium]|nr:methyltransferase domain-containing protein [Actinomycetota bacterium]MDD5666059.1 methyltransferase domain-containing protein [Actinomycetota bacterium]